MNLVRKILSFEKEKAKAMLDNSKNPSNIYEVLTINDLYRTPPQKLSRFVMRDMISKDIAIGKLRYLHLKANYERKYYSNTTPQNICIFYIHGGGFCTGFAEQGVYLLKSLMKHFGCDCVCPRYPLSPEKTYPKALDMIEKIYDCSLSQYKRIVIVGESAGANLVISLMLKLRAKRKKLPDCALLLSGFFDLTRTLFIHKNNEISDVSLHDSQLKYMAYSYLFGENISPNKNSERLKIPTVSPVFARLNNFPPLFFSACKDEILYDDTLKMIENCKRDNITHQLYSAKECFHAYAILGDFLPESSRATKKMIKFITDHTKIQSTYSKPNQRKK